MEEETRLLVERFEQPVDNENQDLGNWCSYTRSFSQILSATSLFLCFTGGPLTCVRAVVLKQSVRKIYEDPFMDILDLILA